MSQLYINTAHNVRIAQTPASVAERIVAQLIDYALFAGYSLIFFGLLRSLAESATYSVIVSLPMFFYDLVCETTMNGQSVGKKVMGIRVVRDDGSEPEIGGYVLRWMFRLIDTATTFGTVATLTVILNGKGKRLGDIVAGTRIIRMQENIKRERLLPELPADYTPQFLAVVNLSDKDIQIIREVLAFSNENPNSPPANAMLTKTKTMVENKLQLKSDWFHYTFLEKVVMDYTYFSLNS